MVTALLACRAADTRHLRQNTFPTSSRARPSVRWSVGLSVLYSCIWDTGKVKKNGSHTRVAFGGFARRLGRYHHVRSHLIQNTGNYHIPWMIEWMIRQFTSHPKHRWLLLSVNEWMNSFHLHLILNPGESPGPGDYRIPWMNEFRFFVADGINSVCDYNSSPGGCHLCVSVCLSVPTFFHVSRWDNF